MARKEIGKGSEGKEEKGKGFAGPISNCFLRAWRRRSLSHLKAIEMTRV